MGINGTPAALIRMFDKRSLRLSSAPSSAARLSNSVSSMDSLSSHSNTASASDASERPGMSGPRNRHHVLSQHFPDGQECERFGARRGAARQNLRSARVEVGNKCTMAASKQFL